MTIKIKKNACYRFRHILALILLFGCEKYYVSVRQMHIDASYLASTEIATPDPRKAHPPFGQKLIIDWTVPPKILGHDSHLVLSLIYKNHTPKEISYPILYRTGIYIYSLLNQEFEETQGLLTYRAEIIVEGKVYREWKHQLWVNLITLEKESTTSAE